MIKDLQRRQREKTERKNIANRLVDGKQPPRARLKTKGLKQRVKEKNVMAILGYYIKTKSWASPKQPMWKVQELAGNQKAEAMKKRERWKKGKLALRTIKYAVLCAGLKIVQLRRCIWLWTKCSEIYRERWKRPFAKRQCEELCIEIIFNEVKRVMTSLKSA